MMRAMEPSAVVAWSAAAGPTPSPFWRAGGALDVGPAGLTLGGVALAPLARGHGTPLYVYDAATIRRRVAALREALATVGVPYAIHYALKANRFPPVLACLRAEGVAIDVCSPREVAWALAQGWQADQISATAGMLSGRDLAAFAAADVHVNLDARSALRRWAATLAAAGKSASPAAAVGLRINPEVTVGWGEEPKLAYGHSKFGFDGADVLAAAAYAASLGLTVNELHIHPGWGLQAAQAATLGGAMERLVALANAIPSVTTLNVGGGLCWPQRPDDSPLALATWADLIRAALAHSERPLRLKCEPGTYIMAASGVLVAEVTTVEPRRLATWVGLDIGHNTNVFAAHYGIPMAIVPVADPLAEPTVRYHVAGNINEANDIFAKDRLLPPLAEGDLVALFPAGAYGTSMASDHCMRGFAGELLVDTSDRAAS